MKKEIIAASIVLLIFPIPPIIGLIASIFSNNIYYSAYGFIPILITIFILLTSATYYSILDILKPNEISRGKSK